MEKIHYSRLEYRNEYLRSEEWRRKSAIILQRDPICRICDKSPSSDAHHLTYDRIHAEAETDLIGVCRQCHNFVHRHRELAQIANLLKLRAIFRKAKRTHFFDDDLLSRIESNNSGNVRLRIAGVLKVPTDYFPRLLGSKINFFKKCKIEFMLSPNYRAPEPRKSKRVRNWRNQIATLI